MGKLQKFIVSSLCFAVVLAALLAGEYFVGFETVMADTATADTVKSGLYHEGNSWNYYENGEIATGKTEKTGLPSSNVLYYELSDGAWCCVRPSGTEPKIKFYFGVVGNSLENSAEKLDALKEAMMAYVEQ